jgi:hypothetical protein
MGTPVVAVLSKVGTVNLGMKIETPTVVGVDVTVEVVTEPVGEVVVELAAASVPGLSSWFHHPRLGNCTGVKSTIISTTATRQPPATARSLRLCSMAPNNSDKNKPLRRKNRAMLTELLTFSGYQNPAPAGTRQGETLRRPHDLPSAGGRWSAKGFRIAFAELSIIGTHSPDSLTGAS